MKLTELIDALQALLARVGDLDLTPAVPELKKPFSDLKALKTEIETGPLAKSLTPFWNDVFEHPGTERPEHLAQASSWEVKVGRAGRLKTDAAFQIHAMLNDVSLGNGIQSRSQILGWDQWSYKLVVDAKAA